MRLGETLVQKGILGEAKLKQALDAQLIHGGHLGTCLIEAGFVAEWELGPVLAEMMGVGYADPELFRLVPGNIVAKLPAKLVERHHAVPFRDQGNTLDVAMVDPRDLEARDALEFACGSRVRVWVSPEVRIFQAMEHYYGIPRRARYVRLCHDLDHGDGGDRPFEAARVPSFRWRNETRYLEASPAPPSEPAVAADPLEQVTRDLALCGTAEELAEAVLSHCAWELSRCVLFKVTDDGAEVWKARGVDVGSLGEVQFPVTDEPVFGLLDGEDSYRGPVPEQEPYRRFYEVLGVAKSREALMLPIHIDDQLIGFFYGDNGEDGPIGTSPQPYRRLMRKLAVALRMVSLKRSIHAI